MLSHSERPFALDSFDDRALKRMSAHVESRAYQIFFPDSAKIEVSLGSLMARGRAQLATSSISAIELAIGAGLPPEAAVAGRQMSRLDRAGTRPLGCKKDRETSPSRPDMQPGPR
jgi:hypothetical protein